MPRLQALSVTFAVLVLAGIGGCRDWDRFDPTAEGGGGAAPSVGSTGSNGSGSNGSSASSASDGSSSSGSAGGGGSGGGGDACGTVDILSDDFDGAALDWRWEAYGDATFSLEGGDLVVGLPSYESYSQIQSATGFDFRGRTMVLELVTPLSTDAGIWFNVAHDPDNYIEFFVDTDGLIYYNHEIDGNFATFAGEALDPNEYRFWRFREDDGTVYFDLSNDGATWMERTSYDISSLIDPAFTSVYVGANAYDTGQMQEARVARVYSGEPEAPGACPISSLTDDFDDGVMAPVWSAGWSGTSCSASEATSTLEFTCPAMVDDDAGYWTATAFDLAASQVSWEVVAPPAAGSLAYLTLVVSRPEVDSGWALAVDDGQLNLFEITDASWVFIRGEAHDPVGDRFLRIREAGGQVYFETSPDGVSFAGFDQRPASIDVTAMEVVLFGGATNNPGAVTVAVDNLNVGP
jgi:hypothetical protein